MVILFTKRSGAIIALPFSVVYAKNTRQEECEKAIPACI